MILKFALCDNQLIPIDIDKNVGMVKTASGSIMLEPGSDKAKVVEAEIKKHPTALFFRSKAIKANEPNSNGDYFSESELLKAYKSFEGVPFFTNHDNQNVENARGKVIFAEWIPEEKSVYTISFVDREAFPHICRSIEENYITGVSMGASVEYSTCNICENRAERTEDYCSHIKERKGRKFSGKAKNVRTGEIKEFKNEPVFEYNYGIKFIELSAVVDPACPSCRIQGIIKNDDLIKKVANLQNTLFMKVASIEKTAGQDEIQKLNDVLKTLEQISIQLIQNRQQVEVAFASDLVGILSELQTFVDELVGAGYGNVQAVPGVQSQPNQPQQLPPQSLPADVLPVAEENPIAPQQPPAPAPQVGSVSGSPSNPAVKLPNLPISAPAKPRAFESNKIQRIADYLVNWSEKANNTGDDSMSRRLTAATKIKQQKIASEVLSNSWQEKQAFLENIKKVPSVQNNDCKLTVKAGDDSFVIIAEEKKENPQQMTWTYEMLNDEEKSMIKDKPREAALNLLGKFTNNLKNIKEGETVMSNTKEAGAKSVNKAPEVVTEAQLEEKGIYHPRTGEDKNVITQKQLEEKREGEKEVITEAQLQEKSNKMHPRTEETAEVITEKQLDGDNVSSRKDTPNTITQDQLKENRTDTNPEVITEKQLESVDTPWSRAAKRNSAMFKSASDHMKAVVDAMANTVMATGCTSDEVCKVASSLVASTKDRFELGNAILDESKDEDIDYSVRLAYWSKKNIKVASVGSKEIAESLVMGLRKLASDMTINPETIIDALDVASEGVEGSNAISKKVDEKIAAAKTVTIQASKKDELRKALKEEKKEEKVEEKKAESKVDDAKLTREAERAVLTKVAEKTEKKLEKKADHIIETSFAEIGCAKKSPEFKSTLKSFAKGALASQNIKLAAITNVTISGDTISIAVQTDAGEESVQIPVGEQIAPMEGETVPEADVAGEGLENAMGAPASQELSPDTGLPANFPTAKSKKVTKQAQIGGMGGGVPGTPGGVAAPGAPEAGVPGAAPTDMPVQALTTDEETAEIPDEIPTAGQQQPPWSICPECGSTDVDVTNEGGNGKGKCNGCGAEYEAMVKKEVEFKITKPTKSVGSEGTTGAPEAPEVPALPVAAQTQLNKGSIIRISSNVSKNGHVCPSCGMKHCKASKENEGHTEFTCPACKTDITKDIVVNVNSPDDSYLRVQWDLKPNVEACSSCKEAVTKFASTMKVEKIVKQAAESKFPMANCMERVARQWGGNSVATFGPCKGKPLAACVCSQLEKLGLNKVRHLERLGSVYMQKDPMDECVEDQMKQHGFSKKEAETTCNCLKKKYASKEDGNVFLMAFAEDIKSGKEKILTAQDLDAVNDVFVGDEAAEIPPVEEDIDIGEPLEDVAAEPVEEFVTIEVTKETAQEIADAAQKAAEDIEIEVEPAQDIATDEPAEVPVEETGSDNINPPVEETQMAMAMQTHKIVRVGEEIVKVAATPNKVKDIEGNVEAKVPRSEQKLGEEAKADSLMNKPNKDPEVPRADAYMGKEKEANSMINKEMKLPDVAVDSSFMGKEKEVQRGMPAINNDIKGTVIAKKDKTVKEAKKMQEVETVEKDVEAKVPRSDGKLGEESKADSLINEPNKKPEVPRSQAYMGEEKGADSLINKELNTPDVPIDSAFMGDEKNVQKDMPGINSEYLKNVQQQKEVQLERLATARRMKAIEVTARLLATNRITEEAYDNVIEALSKFELGKIASVADSMYPKMKRNADSQSAKEVYAGPAIVMESKDIKSSNPVDEMSKRISSHFTSVKLD